MTNALWTCPVEEHVTAETDTFPPRIPYCHDHETEMVWVKDVE